MPNIRILLQSLADALSPDTGTSDGFVDNVETSLARISQALPEILGGKIEAESLAAEYDDQATYDIGDYCTHNGVLYICATAVTTAESWDSAKWVAIPLIEKLKEKLDAPADGAVAGRYLMVGQNGEPVWDQLDESDIRQSVYDWLSAHPEAIVVNDGTITRAKLDNSVGQAVDEVSELKADLLQLDDICFNPATSDVAMWKQGYWAIVDGSEVTYTRDWIHSIKYFDDTVYSIYTSSDLNMFLQAWNKDDGAYVGTWNGSAFTNTYVVSAGKRNIQLSKFRNDYPSYSFTISLKAQDGRDITPAADGAQIFFVESTINSDIAALHNASFKKYKMSEVYERKEISAAQNMYVECTTENPTRARAKQEYIQEVPEGATSVVVKIHADSLANGKYKVGWAYYDSDYKQIQSTVRGWFTADAAFRTSVVENAKYFMLYYAVVNTGTEIILDEIDTAKNSIVFDNSPYNYAETMVNRPVSSELESVDDHIAQVESNLSAKADAETFIYSVNHRGYSAEAPENTLPAYILSKKKGFDYAECDVCFTSDEVAVLLHDSTINRTARNADGTELSSNVNIGDITYTQALTYDFGIWKGSQWQGTPIPTFDQFILTCKKLSLHPFIELKDSVNGTYWTDARIASVANSIKNVGMENHVTFISFAVSALQKMSVHFPNARLGLGFEGTYSTENFASYITNAETLISNDREVIATVNYGSMTDELYSMLTTAGIKPLVWTVNTESAVLNLDETVVGVLSDYLNAGKIILDNLITSV